MENENPCAICGGLVWDEEPDVDICQVCQESCGIPPRQLPHARTPRPCAQCGHTVLVRAMLQERSVEASSAASVAPLGVTFNKAVMRSIWSGEVQRDADGKAIETSRPDMGAPAGILQAYICRACGFTELYATLPAEIPIGRKYGTELVECPETGPYR